jgi:hypothetical protein
MFACICRILELNGNHHQDGCLDERTRPSGMQRRFQNVSKQHTQSKHNHLFPSLRFLCENSNVSPYFIQEDLSLCIHGGNTSGICSPCCCSCSKPSSCLACFRPLPYRSVTSPASAARSHHHCQPRMVLHLGYHASIVVSSPWCILGASGDPDASPLKQAHPCLVPTYGQAIKWHSHDDAFPHADA